MGDTVGGAMANNFRSPVLSEPNLMPPVSSYGAPDMSQSQLLQTPAGNIRALPPPLPQAPMTQSAYGSGGYGGGMGYGGGGYGGGYGSAFGSSFGGGYGGYGGGYGSGYGGFGSSFGGGYGGFGGGYGGYNRFGGAGGSMNPMDPEMRFIQMAESSSRPAFQSIESLVGAIGNIASMLDSTFFALTSSFRAILGVAANFGRLRGVFAQFWQTFAIFRGLNWIYRKILYWLRISNLDPSSEAFKKAFEDALNESNGTNGGGPKVPRKGQSPWPVLAFISFIFTAPYLIMKLVGTVTATAQEEARDPSKWVHPIDTAALYDFQARNASELSLRAGQRVKIAPKEVQNSLGLLNTGWAIASDGQQSGIIPINYVKSPQQLRQDQQMPAPQQAALMPGDMIAQSAPVQPQQPMEPPITQQELLKNLGLSKPEVLKGAPEPSLPNLSPQAFAAPPQVIPPEDLDFDIAPQPMGGGPAAPPTTSDAAINEGFASTGPEY